MWLFTVLLMMVCLAYAQAPASAPKLTDKDQAEIRAVIYEKAKNENAKGTGEVWKEGLPRMYRIQSIEAVAADVAMVEAKGPHTSPMFEPDGNYLFILKRVNGKWSIVKEARLSAPPAVKPPPPSAAPQPEAHGS